LRKACIEYAKDFLKRDGPLSTREIYDLFLDEHPKKCPTMIQLGMILTRNPGVEKEQWATNERRAERWVGHTIWKIKEEVV